MSQLVTRLRNGYARIAANSLARRPFLLKSEQPIVSFTFDDFPRSASQVGGAILERYGARGTYYASLGLMGQLSETGQIFDEPDLVSVSARGHEIGCHTFAHLHAFETAPDDFESSITRNEKALATILPDSLMETLSYPIGNPRVETKRRAERHYRASRAGGQRFNIGEIDLNLLSAFFLEQSLAEPEAIEDMIERSNAQNGWLIFATHDVEDHPTRYGCTPSFFERIVRRAQESGALILPVSKALDALRVPKH